MPRIFIWDFDKTITVEHTTGAVAKSQLNAETIRANVKYLNAFVQFTTTSAAQGDLHFIATFADATRHCRDESPRGGLNHEIGGAEMVWQYLEEIFEDQACPFQRDQIEAWEPECSRETYYRYHKNTHISNILGKLAHQPEPHEVYLIDDSPRNRQKASEEGYQVVDSTEANYIAKLEQQLAEENAVRREQQAIAALLERSLHIVSKPLANSADGLPTAHSGRAFLKASA